MTTPHKATPEQWSRVQSWVDDGGSSTDSCLLELRDRIAALEATQHAHADASRISDADREQFYATLAKPARIEALKTAASAQPDHVRDATEMVPAPAGGLVERVNKALGAASGLPSGNWAHCADAAILAVAEWLDTKGQHGCSLWLREEVARHA
jgi:hypothetical protein